RIRLTPSVPTPARSRPTGPPAEPGSGSTAEPSTPVPRSVPTSTPCWSSSPAADVTSRRPWAGPRAPPPNSAFAESHGRSPASTPVKLSGRGRDFPPAVGRATRALADFPIRGVSSNIGFLQAALDDPSFVAGDLSTSFIEQRPHLLDARVSADRGSKLLDYLADVTVNRPHGEPQLRIRPSDKLPEIDLSETPTAGSHDRLVEL